MSATPPQRACYLFAGGGTGGHIYPALAIAERILDLNPAARVAFAVSTRVLDAEILSRETLGGRPAEFRPIPANPPALRPGSLVRFVRGWNHSVLLARQFIQDLRSHAPTWVVAMGGFVAAPFARAAARERVPLTLVNLDAVPGKANRWIAKRAQTHFTSAPVGGGAWTEVRPIVRRAALAPDDAAACRARLGLDAAAPTLLVTGASQGARSINRAVMAVIEKNPETWREWQVLHQTGKGEDAGVREAYARLGIRARVEAFVSEMGPAWGSATIAISRCGAGNVGEAWANRVPTVFMPYPFHKDQHQRANALPLERAGAARIVTDLVEPERNVGPLSRALDDLSRGDVRAGMARAFEGLGPADGALAIARALVGANA